MVVGRPERFIALLGNRMECLPLILCREGGFHRDGYASPKPFSIPTPHGDISARVAPWVGRLASAVVGTAPAVISASPPPCSPAMRVLSDATTPLADVEVLTLLRERAARTPPPRPRDRRGGAPPPPPPPPARSTAAADAYVGFATATPASTQSVESVAAVAAALRDGWDLTAAEVVQLVNLRVTTLVNLYAVVEGVRLRFTDKQVTVRIFFYW